jgi:cytochrome c oxidase subunit III
VPPVTTTTEEVIKQQPSKPSTSGPGSGDGSHDNGRGGGGGDDNNWGNQDDRSYDNGRLAMWLAIASISVLFIAPTTAYVILITGKKWTPLPIPWPIWMSTIALLASSATLELASRALRSDLKEQFKKWLWITTVLGITFLFGQVLAWQHLVAQKVYLQSRQHSTFFFLLTALHGIHLLGGIFAMFYVVVGALRNRFSAEKRTAVDVTALYWHFMDLLWIYLFLLLFFWRW